MYNQPIIVICNAYDIYMYIYIYIYIYVILGYVIMPISRSCSGRTHSSARTLHRGLTPFSLLTLWVSEGLTQA